MFLLKTSKTEKKLLSQKHKTGSPACLTYKLQAKTVIHRLKSATHHTKSPQISCGKNLYLILIPDGKVNSYGGYESGFSWTRDWKL